MFKNVAKLFGSPARIKIVKFFVLQPDVKAKAPAVAAIVGISKQDVEKELRALTRVGLLSSRKQGIGATFSLNRSHALTPHLVPFLEKTTRPHERAITDVFRSVKGIVGVVATGALTGEARSPVDLLIVTRRKHAYDQGIAQAVKRVERLISLPLTYAVLERREYAERLEARDRLLRNVFDFEHLILFGKRRLNGEDS